MTGEQNKICSWLLNENYCIPFAFILQKGTIKRQIWEYLLYRNICNLSWIAAGRTNWGHFSFMMDSLDILHREKEKNILKTWHIWIVLNKHALYMLFIIVLAYLEIIGYSKL